MSKRICCNCQTKDLLDDNDECPSCRVMRNKAMARKLSKGAAIDVSIFPRDKDGNYILPDYADGADYCDKQKEEWIWSIGKRRSDRTILASTDNRFYSNPDFECLWLR